MKRDRHKDKSTRPGAESSFAMKGPSVRQLAWAGFKFLLGHREKSFSVNPVKAQEFARERFADMLREPFPGLTDKQIAAHWAPRVNRSERTVENWLSLTTSASIDDMLVVGATHGVWESCRIFVGDDTRAEVMEKISR